MFAMMKRPTGNQWPITSFHVVTSVNIVADGYGGGMYNHVDMQIMTQILQEMRKESDLEIRQIVEDIQHNDSRSLINKIAYIMASADIGEIIDRDAAIREQATILMRIDPRFMSIVYAMTDLIVSILHPSNARNDS